MFCTPDRTQVRGHRQDAWFSFPESLSPPSNWTSHHTSWIYGPVAIERIIDPEHYLDVEKQYLSPARSHWIVKLEWEECPSWKKIDEFFLRRKAKQASGDHSFRLVLHPGRGKRLV
jgi:hypothetical protein